METKFTPGPWRFTRVEPSPKMGVYRENPDARDDALWSDATGHAVAVPTHRAEIGFGSFGFSKADAHLVAAAPELYVSADLALSAVRALSGMLKDVGYRQMAEDARFTIRRLEAALRQARGGAP